MTLPRPAELGRDIHMVHLVTARYGNRVISFEGHLDVSGGRFLLAVIDPLGRKALSVQWNGSEIVSDAAPWFPEGLRPENILADLVLIYWPPEVLRRSLIQAHAGFEATTDHRAVIRDGAELIRMDFFAAGGDIASGGRVQYRNLAFGYTLDIRAAAEPVP